MGKTPNQLHYLNNNTDSTCCQVYNPEIIVDGGMAALHSGFVEPEGSQVGL